MGRVKLSDNFNCVFREGGHPQSYREYESPSEIKRREVSWTLTDEELDNHLRAQARSRGGR